MTLTCKQCGYENESERVYCHSCGTKLDRSLLPKEEERAESPQSIRKRVMKFTTPGRFTLWMFLKIVLTAMLWGLVAAALIQMIRAPKDAPQASGDLAGEGPSISYELEEAVEAVGGPLVYTEKDVNAYIDSVVRAKSDGILKYTRTYVNIEPGKIWITTQWSIYQYPLHATTGYELSIQNGKLVSRNVGGYLGRLPVHQEIMQFLDYPFVSFWDAMKRERRLLEKMGRIEFQDDRVLLQPSRTAGNRR